MHGMVSVERQARDDDLRLAPRHDRSRRERKALDAIGLFRVERVLEQSDAGAALAALCQRRAEALNHVGLAAARGVLQRHEKAARGWDLVAVVAPAPGVDVDDTSARHDQMPGMAQVIRKHRGAEAWGKREAGTWA